MREKPTVFELGWPSPSASYHAWAVKKGNKELLDLLNSFLAEQRKNGTMAKLQEKWLGRAFPDVPMEATLPGRPADAELPRAALTGAGRRRPAPSAMRIS